MFASLTRNLAHQVMICRWWRWRGSTVKEIIDLVMAVCTPGLCFQRATAPASAVSIPRMKKSWHHNKPPVLRFRSSSHYCCCIPCFFFVYIGWVEMWARSCSCCDVLGLNPGRILTVPVSCCLSLSNVSLVADHLTAPFKSHRLWRRMVRYIFNCGMEERWSDWAVK